MFNPQNTYIKISCKEINNYHDNNFVTINPNNVEIYVNGKKVNDCNIESPYEIIYANYNTFNYPKEDIKILYLLKESYIKKESFLEGDRGNHNISEEYKNSENLKEDFSYLNMVKMTYALINSINNSDININNNITQFKYDENLWENACNIFYKHAYVININPFPGLSFNTTKTNNSLIQEWANQQWIREFIKETINKIKPNIIYSPSLNQLISSTNIFAWIKGKTLNELFTYDNNLNILDDIFIDNAELFTLSNRKVKIKGLINENNKNRIWVQGAHPSARWSTNGISQDFSMLAKHFNKVRNKN